MTRRLPRVLQPFASLKLTIGLLFGLLVVVFLCTLDQVRLGTHWAVEKDIRSLLIYYTSSSGFVTFPVFPGGGLLGALLLVNLSAALWSRFVWSIQKIGLWFIHIGLIILVAGEFITGFFQVETHMSLEEGESGNYSENSRVSELVVIETTHPEYNDVFSISEARLRRGGEIRHEKLPFTLTVVEFMLNAELTMINEKSPPARATRGMGMRVQATPARRSTTDDPNYTSAYVELREGDRSLGTWFLSTGLGAEQALATEGGRTFSLQMRPRREYMPYTLTLEDFKHDVYAGTDIPKNFSSQLHLSHSAAGEDRHVVIYMNHPLRYQGKTFFQSGFGSNNTVSILQVVENPGWRLPYISFVVIGMGLCIHFVASFVRFRRRQQEVT